MSAPTSIHDPEHPDFEKTHRTGRLPLPRDDKDFRVERVLNAKATLLAKEARIAADSTARVRRLWTMGGATMRLDQGNTGTCEGNGNTNLLIAGPTTHATFPGFATAVTAEAYAQRLYLDATGDETLEQGAYTRQILDELLRRGTIAAYYRVPSVDEVVQALLHVGPVGIGMNWYRSNDRPVAEFGNYYLHVDEASGSRGGHYGALTAVDVAPTAGPPWVRFENSWGPGWCQDGTVRIPLDDLRIEYVGDCWTISETIF